MVFPTDPTTGFDNAQPAAFAFAAAAKKRKRKKKRFSYNAKRKLLTKKKSPSVCLSATCSSLWVSERVERLASECFCVKKKQDKNKRESKLNVETETKKNFCNLLERSNYVLLQMKEKTKKGDVDISFFRLLFLDINFCELKRSQSFVFSLARSLARSDRRQA